MRTRTYPYVLGALTLAAAFSGSSCGGGAEDAPVTPELVVARDRAAEYGAIGNEWMRAYEAIAPFADREDAAVEDLLRAASALLAVPDLEAARPYVERAAKRGDGDLLAWCQFRVASLDRRLEDALEQLDKILAAHPDDYPARVAKVIVLEDLDRSDEALALCEELVEVPVEEAGVQRITAMYRYARLLVTNGEMEKAQPYFDQYTSMTQGQGLEPPGPPEHQPGTLGEIRAHTPTALEPRIPTSSEFPLAGPTFIEDAAGQAGMRVVHLTSGTATEDMGLSRAQLGRKDKESWGWRPSAPAVVVWGQHGLELMQRQGQAWGRTNLIREAVLDAVPFDRANAPAQRDDEAQKEAAVGLLTDRDLDFIVVLPGEAGAGAEVRLLESRDGRWQAERPLLFTVSAYPESGRIVTVDYDHDGDLDLLAGVDGRARLFRNDGFDHVDGTFTEVTDETGMPTGDLVPIPEDLDGDNDVDFVFRDAASGRVVCWSNLRAERFADVTGALPAMEGEWIVLADLDGDARCDVTTFGDAVRVYRRDALGKWLPPLEWPLSAPPIGRPTAGDWDQDGLTDITWPVDSAAAAAGLLAPGFEVGGVAFDLAARGGTGAATVAAVDIDDDLDLDLLRLDATGFFEFTNDASKKGVLIGLLGEKDNSRGVGAIVEVRRGLDYRRIYWRGEARLLGFAEAERIDVLRVTWPNGVQQSFFDVPFDARFQIWQRRGLAGSCPFLYTWNGETYEFISDVIGITPLGLPMEPGMYVPPDHDEFVLVRGSQLVPKDGFYELQFTEELREVTYLDRVRLDVIDHPAGVEVFPNERFSFPPFPEHHTHTVVDPAGAVSVVDGEGRDWTRELAANDQEVAQPFEPLYGQFQGLTPRYSLELRFPAERIRSATKLRLLMNGWLVWTDASVNVAAARHPEVAFVPPILQVPDGQGGWRDAGPPLGFPAGKLKTMVIDVTDMVNREDPRLRLVSTLEIYWDSIRMATDDDSAEIVTTSIEPSSARLWERGFSAPIAVAPPGGEEGEETCGMEWYGWDETTEQPRWNQHPGFYTKLGETLPLVTEIDDCFVIMGAGDALTVRFDASTAPPLKEGWERDFLVFLDGWAKDRDPNTTEALYVEPLPFHGMSGYPYGADESFPDTEKHRTWRAEWNTREARRHIPTLTIRRP